MKTIQTTLISLIGLALAPGCASTYSSKLQKMHEQPGLQVSKLRAAHRGEKADPGCAIAYAHLEAREGKALEALRTARKRSRNAAVLVEIANRTAGSPESIQLAREAVQAGHPGALTALGTSLARSGDHAAALQELLRQVHAAPADYSALKQLAETQLQLGLEQDAHATRQRYHQIVAVPEPGEMPELANALRRGASLLEASNYNQALRVFSETSGRWSNSRYAALGSCYALMGLEQHGDAARNAEAWLAHLHDVDRNRPTLRRYGDCIARRVSLAQHERAGTFSSGRSGPDRGGDQRGRAF